MEKRRSQAALSPEFLTRGTNRLDAIGAWAVASEVFEVHIDWASPTGLRPLWLPCSLRFRIVGWFEDSSFDPDERMFELWHLYLSRQDEFASHFRQLTLQDEVVRELGTAEWARVVVYRDVEFPEPLYQLQAEFQFNRELATSFFYEKEDAFWGFEC